jgi:3-hydroxyisobutyrate dehydrogenase-like beta-hydroxyacid dehydrogenase
MSDVAFFGLGQMGMAMAVRLLEAGHRLTVYNRTADKAFLLEAKGALPAASPEQAVTAGGTLITMVSDDRALRALVDDRVLSRLGPDGVHLSMSTVSPETARMLAESHTARAVHYVACPVFGRPEAAAAGKLWLCVAGQASTKDRVRPLLEAMGQGVFDFGTEPAAANIVKLAGNFLIAAAIEAMAEALSLAEKGGVDPKAVHELLAQTLFACPIYQNYGRAIVQGRFSPPGFSLALGAKDVRLVRDTARAEQVPMPLAGLLEDRFLRSLANGRGDLDWTAIALDQREACGMRDPSQPPEAG